MIAKNVLKILSFSFCTWVPLLPNIVFAHEGTDVGNGGDTMRLLTSNARVDSREVLEKVLECSLPQKAPLRIKNWILNNKEQLSLDILASKHNWVENSAQKTCARTQTTPNSEITFSIDECKRSPFGPDLALELLIHESAHHLGIADESEADLIAKTILDSTLADECDSTSRPLLWFYDMGESVGSSSGRVIVTSDSVRKMITFWDTTHNRKMFSLRNTDLGYNWIGFSPDEKSFVSLIKTNHENECAVRKIDLETSAVMQSEKTFPCSNGVLNKESMGYNIKSWSRDSSKLVFYFSRYLIAFDNVKSEIENLEDSSPVGVGSLKFQSNNKISILERSYFERGETTPNCRILTKDLSTGITKEMVQLAGVSAPPVKNITTFSCFGVFSEDGNFVYVEKVWNLTNYALARLIIDEIWEVNSGKLLRKSNRLSNPSFGYSGDSMYSNQRLWFGPNYFFSSTNDLSSPHSETTFSLQRLNSETPVLELVQGIHYEQELIISPFEVNDGKQIIYGSPTENAQYVFEMDIYLLDIVSGKIIKKWPYNPKQQLGVPYQEKDGTWSAFAKVGDRRVLLHNL